MKPLINIDKCWIDYSVKPDKSHGYAVLTFETKRYYGHREAYRLLIGRIPSHLHIDHLCKNRRCYNPKHLEAVTQAENNRRSDQGIRRSDQRRREQTHCKRGHPLSGNNLASGNKFRACKTCCRERERQRRLRNRDRCTRAARVLRGDLGAR